MTWLVVNPSLGTQDGGWAASIPRPARDNTIASYASSRSSACGGLGILERLQPHWRLINQRKLPPPGFFSGFVPPGGKWRESDPHVAAYQRASSFTHSTNLKSSSFLAFTQRL